MTIFPQPLAEHNTDLSNELDAKQFAEQHGFYLACTAEIKPEARFVKNPNVNPIQYVPTKGHEEQYKEYQEDELEPTRLPPQVTDTCAEVLVCSSGTRINRKFFDDTLTHGCIDSCEELRDAHEWAGNAREQVTLAEDPCCHEHMCKGADR